MFSVQAIVGRCGLVPGYHSKGIHRHLLWSLALWIGCCLLVTCCSYSSVPKEVSIPRKCACVLRPFLTTLVFEGNIKSSLFCHHGCLLDFVFYEHKTLIFNSQQSNISKDLVVVAAVF